MVDLSKDNKSKKLLRRGSFRCARRHELIYVMIILGIGVGNAVFWFFALNLHRILFGGNHGYFEHIFEHIDTLMEVYLLLIQVGIIVLSPFFVIATHGTSCEYAAEETEFVIKGPGKQTEYFYYDDIVSMNWEELKLFGLKRGYHVVIETGVRTIEYRYIYGKNKLLTGFEDTPFYFLAVNCGLVEHRNDGSGITLEQVCTMMVSKSAQRLKEEQCDCD